MSNDLAESKWLGLLRDDGFIAVFHLGGWSGDSWTIHDSLWEAVAWARHFARVALEGEDPSTSSEAAALLAFKFEVDESGSELPLPAVRLRLDEFLDRLAARSKGFVMPRQCFVCNFEQLFTEPTLQQGFQEWLESEELEERAAREDLATFERYLISCFQDPGAFVHDSSCHYCSDLLEEGDPPVA